jgi:hypothetical protein
MSQAGPDIGHFISSILEEPYENMVFLAEQEAICMERRSYRADTIDSGDQACYRQYAEQLKEFLSYVRSDVARGVTGGDCERYLNLIRSHT